MIDIAFCFDKNHWMAAGVAIGSLLYSRGECEYRVYCVVSPDIPLIAIREIEKSVEAYGGNNQIHFITATDEFDRGFINQMVNSTATYYKCLLPWLLPDLDRIIYSDTDILYFGDLGELENIDLGNNLLAAAISSLGADYKAAYKRELYREKTLWRDYNFAELYGKYFNSGFMVMNLALIRQENMLEKLVGLSKVEFVYREQDVLNHICRGRVMLLPPKFNVRTKSVGVEIDKATGACTMDSMADYGLATHEEVNMAKQFPIMAHYTGIKPFNGDVYMSDIFWHFAAKTPFYAALWHNYTAKTIDYNKIKNDIRAIVREEINGRSAMAKRKYPKLLIRVIALFIFNREKRHKFRDKYGK